MILLVTNKRDVTSDFVVLEMRRRGLPFIRLNTEDLPQHELVMADGDPGRLTLNGPCGNLCLPEVTCAYYRRPGSVAAGGTEAAAAYVMAEWSAILRSLWNALEGRWLNSPFSILRAEDKPRQLAAARRMGLTMPGTLVTNSFDAARAFLADGPMVAKPLRHALIDDGKVGSIVFTSRVAELEAGDADAVRRAPMILQREIPKRSDVRVVVIDDRVFATKILSQAHDETRVDWRRGVRLDLVHEVMELPAELVTACIAVTHDLGLRFAAIDLVEDEDGQFWFLEANPNGQWAWIEQRTAAPVTAAIVDALVGGRVG
ncbi:ATP-dependent carboxylate-amine ligase [Xanthobacter tagetidis]|uniref:ATP-dependent carboxylate-amine ligase n=1 Tax=Xanthobacter tagetidis TaxID=60216 RepID=A0A3L7AJT7_9HYPH|nr:ATP-dependent carboxylate-amine ligase [Xanthobacter tagetidis]MBB6306373.1 glutathione synthase/RimK-type ligase-like ATP-grasp enzyme [Xanthobacter tagetidis]RLP79632.1 ATP-dependent carboxylate-amine ligase [Xanthobacter tagetidis]